jgi:hypothetical protein
LDGNNHILDTQIGQLLGSADGFADGTFRKVEIAYRARLYPLRFMQRRTQHLDAAMLGPPNDAGNL